MCLIHRLGSVLGYGEIKPKLGIPPLCKDEEKPQPNVAGGSEVSKRHGSIFSSLPSNVTLRWDRTIRSGRVTKIMQFVI